MQEVNMKKQFLEIGKIVATQGIRGEVRAQYYCDSAEVLCDFDTLYFDKGKTQINVTRAYPHKNIVVMKIEGIDTIEQAQPIIGKILYMDREDAELEEGLYFIQDIIGAKVIDEKRGEIGKLVDVMETPASNIYVVKGETEHLIPAVPEFIMSTDADAGIINVRLIEGM